VVEQHNPGHGAATPDFDGVLARRRWGISRTVTVKPSKSCSPGATLANVHSPGSSSGRTGKCGSDMARDNTSRALVPSSCSGTTSVTLESARVAPRKNGRP
jgi:hypothetical protein